MGSVEFQTVPLCSRIQGFSFCSVPLGPVSFHRIAAIIAASALVWSSQGEIQDSAYT
jgi:hypothetical protein